MRRMRLMTRAALVLMLAAPAIALAQDAREPRHDAPSDVVSLQAQAEREIANDQLVVLLSAEARGSVPGALADQINRKMRNALELAKAYPAVRARSGNYQTYPEYADGRITGWRVSQELRLEGSDFAAVTELVGKLQSDLLVRSLSLGLSPEARRAAENTLIVEAIDAFRQRADIVRDALKAKSYGIRELQLSSGGDFVPRPVALSAARVASSVAPPAVEPGSSRITVTASGSIQLK